MKKKSEELENFIDKGNKNVFFQNINKHKKNVKFKYDSWVIEEYRKKFPKKIEKLEIEAIKKLPYLKHKVYKKFLDKKVNSMIFPAVIEKPDGYFYWEKSHKKGRTAGGYHLKIEAHKNEIVYKKESIGGEQTLLYEILNDLLDELTLEENTIIKLYYGIDPYEKNYTEKEIFEILSQSEKEVLGISKLKGKKAERKIKEIVDSIINNIKNNLSKGE